MYTRERDVFLKRDCKISSICESGLTNSFFFFTSSSSYSFVIKKISNSFLFPEILANISVVAVFYHFCFAVLLTFRYFTICKFPFYWMRREEISNGKYSKEKRCFYCWLCPFFRSRQIPVCRFVWNNFKNLLLFYHKSTIDTKRNNKNIPSSRKQFSTHLLNLCAFYFY